MLLVRHVPSQWSMENEGGVFELILLLICRMMPTNGIVPIPCATATERVVQLPADTSTRPSKFSGALARRAVWRKVLAHVALGHENRVDQRKSPPLVGFNSLPVA